MPNQPLKIAVLGAGAWGTALAIAFAQQHQVLLYGRDAAYMADCQHARINARYLPDCVFPHNLVCGAHLSDVLLSDACILVTPTVGLRTTLQQLKQLNQPIPPIIWACKGFEQGSALLPHQVVGQELPEHPVGVLSGPSFAKEVAQGLPAALTLASLDTAFAQTWMHALSAPRLRLYASDDMIGVEVGGAVKNILAIAAGISDGLQLGMNARAALLTRGLAEMTRLVVALGGKQESAMGLSGMGDLVLTATGHLSRNRKVGEQLAQGLGLEAILAQLGHVAEGVATTKAVLSQAQALGVEMPICEAVGQVLFAGEHPKDALERLLNRTPKKEG